VLAIYVKKAGFFWNRAGMVVLIVPVAAATAPDI
jgi:hypothetical protein